MTDDERERIRTEATKDANIESRISSIEGKVQWAMRALWTGAAYGIWQLWDFITKGGTLK